VTGATYDRIGRDYAASRRPDPRIAANLTRTLGDARTVLNVGAGTGSYEPADRHVTAVEPSAEMIDQRPPGSAPVVRASAERLPFPDGSFDASTAILTVHHWSDKARGLGEVRRVTRGSVVVLTFDPAHRNAWLLDYLPEIAELDATQMPAMADYARWMGPVSVTPVPIPHDCTDGFLHAYWRRPEAYLDPKRRAAISTFWRIDAEAGLARLEADLRSGAWNRRHGLTRTLDACDLGYRLVVSERQPDAAPVASASTAASSTKPVTS